MKKALIAVLFTGVFASCNNTSNDTTDQKIDSLNERKDTLIENVDSSINQKIDSLKEKKEELKDRFDSSIEAKKDSVKKTSK
jgi:peptidoglycan hydrolase CwlO-like protein